MKNARDWSHLEMEKGYEMFKNPIIEDNGTKKNCPNLGRNMELEKKIKEVWRNHCEQEERKIYHLPFPIVLQKYKVWNKTSKILEVLKQVKINISFIDMIKFLYMPSF